MILNGHAVLTCVLGQSEDIFTTEPKRYLPTLYIADKSYKAVYRLSVVGYSVRR